jgi:hypothetical protein
MLHPQDRSENIHLSRRPIRLLTWYDVCCGTAVFSVAQAILSPFIVKVARRYAPAFFGGIGLGSTLLAFILASILTRGLTIRGIESWIAATVVVLAGDSGGDAGVASADHPRQRRRVELGGETCQLC